MEEQELLCFIDWLGLSVRVTDEPRPIPGYAWKEYTATNVWGKRRVLWTENGDRVCTLLSEPRSTILDAHAGLLEVDNEWLYHGGGTEAIMQTVLRSVFFEVTGISRLDLCVDFVPNESQKDIIMGLSEGRYYVQGKRSGSGFWSTNTCEHLNPDWIGKKIPHSQSWGHKTSDIKWKLYYKTRELWEAGGWKLPHKPYIIDQWREHGMDESNVWRLEVSCKHLNNLQLYGEVIDLEVLRHFRGQLMVNFYNGRFTVRKSEGHIDRTNDTVVPFLPMPEMPRNINITPSKRLAEHHGRITLLRHLIQSLDDEQVFLDEESRMGVFEHIYKLVQRDHLENYFKAMVGKFVDEYIADKDTEARELFSKKVNTCSILYMEEKGSNAATQRYDVPLNREKFEHRPNLEFDSKQGESQSWSKSEALQRKEREIEEKIQRLYDSMKRDTPPDWTLPGILP